MGWDKCDEEDGRRKQGLRIKLPGGVEVEMRGLTIVMGSCLILVTLLSYMVWQHEQNRSVADTTTQQILTRSLDELSKRQRETTQAQMLTNCIIAMPQDSRQNQFTDDNSLCRRMTR